LNSSLSQRIGIVEENWLGLVRPHISKLFAGTFIPSHDHTHHSRVWNICKNLLQKLEGFSSVADEDVLEGLLLASWFHDAGMVYDSGELHGALGKDVFERFIADSGAQKPVLYDDVLKVIALHDSKEPSLYRGIVPGKAPGMMGVLSIADDLDALGTVGIYRYSEIYLKRGVPAGELGTRILSNVRRRYSNICESCAAFPGLAASFLEDYILIEDFFNRYNQLMVFVKEAEKLQCGELAIINYINAFSVEAKVRPEDFLFQPGIASSGARVKTYFKKLHDEMESKAF